MTLSIILDGADRTSIVDFASFSFTEAAFLGEVGRGGMNVDDPAATLDIKGLRPITVSESVDVTMTRLFTGYVGEKGLGRGTSRVAASEREWDVSLADANVLLADRIINAGSRPAETDVARVNWLVASAFLPSIVGTYVSAASPVNLDAANFTGQTPLDVLNACATEGNKNFFVTWNGASLALFYAPDTSAIFDSTLRLSDDPADVDNTTTFAPDWEAGPGRERDPSEVYSGVWVEYGTGKHVFVQSGTIASNFRQRERRVSSDRVKTSAAATALANTYLTAFGVEEDRYFATIHVPRDRVNLARAGQRIQLKSRAVAVTAFTFFRIVHRTVMPGKVEGGGPSLYSVRLELARPVKWRPRIGSGGASGTEAGANAVAEVENTGSAFGLSGVGIEHNEVTQVLGLTGTSSQYTLVTNFNSLETVGCPFLEGHWQDPWKATGYLSSTVSLPADDASVVDAILTFTGANNGAHGPFGPYGTVNTNVRGPHVVYGGNTDIAGGAVTATLADFYAGSPFATFYSTYGTVTYTIHVPRSMLNFGGITRFRIAPGWGLTATWICQGLFGIGGANDGFLDLPAGGGATLQLRRFSAGTYGWYSASPVEVPNGSRVTFTLVGGYSSVRQVWLNSVPLALADWSATNVSTITLASPPPTGSLLVVEYYLPKS